MSLFGPNEVSSLLSREYVYVVVHTDLITGKIESVEVFDRKPTQFFKTPGCNTVYTLFEAPFNRTKVDEPRIIQHEPFGFTKPPVFPPPIGLGVSVTKPHPNIFEDKLTVDSTDSLPASVYEHPYDVYGLAYAKDQKNKQ